HPLRGQSPLPLPNGSARNEPARADGVGLTARQGDAPSTDMSEISEYLHQMLTGPGHLRFLLQPVVAILIGVLDGLRDSHAGHGPFWRWVWSRPGGERGRRLTEGLHHLVVPLCLGLGLSLVFQYVNRRSVHLIPALVAALFLVALPYAIT